MQLFVKMANILLLIVPLLTAILVVKFTNPIYVALSVILTFIATAICWIILSAEFLAFTLILLYVGAVMVVFLFIIMMLDLKPLPQDLPETINSKSFKSLLLAISLGAIFIYISKDYSFAVTTSVANNNLFLLAQTLFSDYILLFCMAALLLLSPIIFIGSTVIKKN